MIFGIQIDWVSVSIGVALAFIILNLIQFAASYFKLKNAVKQKEVIEGRILDLQKKIEKAREELRAEILKREK